MNREPLTLEMTFADGAGEVAVDLDHPLVAPFRRAVETGRYTGDWVYLAVRPSADERVKLLGAFARTPGNRLLYFPGRRGEVQSTHQDAVLNGGVLDHVTLELSDDMSEFSEHVAILAGGGDHGSRTRGQRRAGVIHKNHLHPWFSLLRTSLDDYPDLPARFTFDFQVPASDLTRRLGAMMGTGQRTAMTFPAHEGAAPHYYQVDVWAGRGDGWEKRFAQMIAWPAVGDVVEQHRGEVIERKAQFHHVSTDCGVVVVLTRPSGRLLRGGLAHPVIAPVTRIVEGNDAVDPGAGTPH